MKIVKNNFRCYNSLKVVLDKCILCDTHLCQSCHHTNPVSNSFLLFSNYLIIMQRQNFWHLLFYTEKSCGKFNILVTKCLKLGKYNSEAWRPNQWNDHANQNISVVQIFLDSKCQGSLSRISQSDHWELFWSPPFWVTLKVNDYFYRSNFQYCLKKLEKKGQTYFSEASIMSTAHHHFVLIK